MHLSAFTRTLFHPSSVYERRLNARELTKEYFRYDNELRSEYAVEVARSKIRNVELM